MYLTRGQVHMLSVQLSHFCFIISMWILELPQGEKWRPRIFDSSVTSCVWIYGAVPSGWGIVIWPRISWPSLVSILTGADIRSLSDLIHACPCTKWYKSRYREHLIVFRIPQETCAEYTLIHNLMMGLLNEFSILWRWWRYPMQQVCAVHIHNNGKDKEPCSVGWCEFVPVTHVAVGIGNEISEWGETWWSHDITLAKPW